MKFSFLILCISFVFLAQAQSHRAFAQAGKKAMKSGNCHAAMDFYQQAQLKKPSKSEYTYHLAQAAMECNAFELAEKAFSQIVKLGNSPFLDASFQLGLAQKNQGKYAAAQKSFENYLTVTKSLSAQTEIENCQYALSLHQESPYTIKNMGKKINSPYSEFAPVIKNDTFFYSSFRFDNRKDWAKPRRKLAKTVYSTYGRKGRPLRYHFNKDTVFTANLCFLPDGSGVYYNHCQYVDGMKVRCDLYFRQPKKKRGWKKPIKLKINNPEFTTTQPAYYLDNETNKSFILFSSNRSGGQGELDIWMAPIEDKHQLGEPINLSIINTPGNEITPFYAANQKELFFSSDQHLNIGGYDIFKIDATKLPLKTEKIIPLPQPINSPANDIFFVPNQDGLTGYLASNRTGSQFIDKQNQRCCNDLYFWNYTPPKEEFPDTLIVSKTTDTITPRPKPPTKIPTPKPIISISAQSMLDLLPIRLFFDNDEPDKRTTATTTKKNYIQTYNRYLPKRAKFVQEFCKPLLGDDKENAQYDLEDFFDYEVKEGGETLQAFSELLVQALKNGEQLNIVLKGYTSPRAKSDYNNFLAARRISSVKNHFNSFHKGIFKHYIQSGQLTISERPLGEAQTPTGISDDLWDRRMSVYSVSASTERRVEIIDILIE